MLRVFSVDVLRCNACGSRRQLIAGSPLERLFGVLAGLRPTGAYLTQADVIPRMLERQRLPADPPALSPARAPPQPALPI